MTNDQISGQIKVLEVLVMTALGLYLANASNDPDYSKATALLDYIRNSVSASGAALNSAAKQEADRYARDLTSNLASNLRTMRGEAGQIQ